MTMARSARNVTGVLAGVATVLGRGARWLGLRRSPRTMASGMVREQAGYRAPLPDAPREPTVASTSAASAATTSVVMRGTLP